MDDISKFQHSFKSSYQNTIIHGRTGHTNEAAPDLTFETIHPDDPHTNYLFVPRAGISIQPDHDL